MLDRIPKHGELVRHDATGKIFTAIVVERGSDPHNEGYQVGDIVVKINPSTYHRLYRYLENCLTFRREEYSFVKDRWSLDYAE